MWALGNISNVNGENILRWMFLFAAPNLYATFEENSFSLVHLLTALTALAVANVFALLLTKFVVDMSKEKWVIYGRSLNFLGHVLSIAITGIQIWSGFIIANLVTSMFVRHSSFLVFTAFTVTGIFLLGAINAVFTPVEELR